MMARAQIGAALAMLAREVLRAYFADLDAAQGWLAAQYLAESPRMTAAILSGAAFRRGPAFLCGAVGYFNTTVPVHFVSQYGSLVPATVQPTFGGHFVASDVTRRGAGDVERERCRVRHVEALDRAGALGQQRGDAAEAARLPDRTRGT